MSISAKAVKALRDETGAGMMDCKRVLTDAGGDVQKAMELLRERGLAKAGKRAGPALGWAHRERMSLLERGPAKASMALALIHHLALSNNVPLLECARFFAELGEYLIIEFVPKTDSQVQRLLRTREDIFPDYHREGFEAAFAECFSIIDSEPVAGSERRLYLMRRGTAALG